MDLDLLELDFNADDTDIPPPFELQEENEDNLAYDILQEMQGVDITSEDL